ncbi:MAG TPA: hypothetical protein VGI05_10405 [Streptosporangiaceae bacterium]|jgi:hypothetical protein
MAERPLPGGFVTAVARAGKTVRRVLAKAQAGDPAMIRLRDSGAARSVRDAFDWVTRHRAELAAPLR